MKKLYLISIFILFFASAEAQLPTVGDCLGAIPICSTYYDEPDPYIWSGTGNYPDEILRTENDGCMINEQNGMWYTFTSLNDGLLRFIIIPHDSLTDYDWNVFDITHGNCSDLKTTPQQYRISSNTYGAYNTTLEESLTGANSSISGGTGNCNGPGIDNGPAWNDDIPVYKDHIYIIYISNWSNSAFGYSIDFSESTADIWDRKAPELNALLETPNCGQTQLTILFSENVLCNKISKEFFRVRNSTKEFTVSSVFSKTCEFGGTYSREFNLDFEEPLEPGNYILNYTDTLCDICGNKTPNDSIEFQIDTLKIVKIEKQDILCAGDENGTILITANQSTEDLFYTINGIDFYENTNSFENLLTGEYSISVKNKYNCETHSEIISIIEPDTLKGSRTKTDVFPCFSNNNGKIKIQTTGGTPPLQYSINNGNNYSSNSIFENLLPNQYQIIVKDANNCIHNLSNIEITEPDEVKIQLIDKQDVLCNSGNSAFIEINTFPANYTILWSSGDNTSRAENLSTGNYKVTVQDENNCEDNLTFTIFEPKKLLYQKEIGHINCFGEATGFAKVSVSGGTPEYNFLWSNNSTDSTIENLSAGKYSVIISDANNCKIYDTLETTQAPEIELTLTGKWSTSNIIPDGSIIIDVQGGTPSYEIELSAEILRPPYDIYALYSDLYTVTITDANGCQTSDTVRINPIKYESEIEVPNVFTPNNDGFNDLFLLKAHGIESFSCIIVNRWGRKVYAFNNFQGAWDGKVNHSSEASEGVYFYVIKAIGIDKKPYLLKGSFYLVR